MATSILSHERLLELLSYDSETGLFTWRVQAGRIKAGSPAGHRTPSGYCLIRIDGALYKAHRLAWFYATGSWPEHHIDHKSSVPSDNRLANLRDCEQSVNMQNLRKAHRGNTSGYLGVSWHAGARKWFAQIKVPLKKNNLYLGLFNDPREAHKAYLDAKRKYHVGGLL